MKLRLAISIGISAALGIASCQRHQQMSTTKLEENTTSTSAIEAVATASTPGATERVNETGYTQSICDAAALRHNEVCFPNRKK